jgi:hypothetical protein
MGSTSGRRLAKLEQRITGGDGFVEANAVACAWLASKTGTATAEQAALIDATPYADVLRHRRTCASRAKGGGPGLIERLNAGARRAREGDPGQVAALAAIHRAHEEAMARRRGDL